MYSDFKLKFTVGVATKKIPHTIGCPGFARVDLGTEFTFYPEILFFPTAKSGVPRSCLCDQSIQIGKEFSFDKS
eukprot:12100197-Ditylum_brightwellii.AAC.1